MVAVKVNRNRELNSRGVLTSDLSPLYSTWTPDCWGKGLRSISELRELRPLLPRSTGGQDP